MSAPVVTPSPRRDGRRMPDHSGIRLPLGRDLRRRFVPGLPERSPHRRGPNGSPPLRAA